MMSLGERQIALQKHL